MWMFVEQFLKGPPLTKFRNFMLDWKDIARYEAGYQLGLGEPEVLCSKDLWSLWNTEDIGRNGDEITAKGMCI